MNIKFKNGSIVKTVKKGPSFSSTQNKKKKIKKSQVIRILSAMDKDNQEKDQQQSTQQQQQTPSGSSSSKKMDELQDEFLNTGRIGRRNAMPDILDENRETSTADLPLKLSALTTSDSSSSSTCHQAPNQTNNK